MNPVQTVVNFVNSIEQYGTASISRELLGVLIDMFPIVGGGTDCLVLNINDAIIRVMRRNNSWVAEHLIVRGRSP